MFQFYTPPFKQSSPHHGYVVATLAKNIHGTKKLLAATGSLLGFPPHFGKNFDAFWDCLRDLPEKPGAIALVHQDLPKVDADDLEVYLELLRDTVLYWQKRADEHVFEVWFAENDQKAIEDIMKDIPPPEDEELE